MPNRRATEDEENRRGRGHFSAQAGRQFAKGQHYRKRREFTAPGDHQIIIKQLIFAPRVEYWTDPANFRGRAYSTVIVEMLNPAVVFQINPDALLGIHKCLGPVPDDYRSFKADDDWIRQQARQRQCLEPG